MNYIWQVANKLKTKGVNPDDIYFRQGETYSPYTEVSLTDMTLSDIILDIDINPYYRFYNIFKDLYPPDYTESEELRNTLFDIIIHHLLNVDKKQGMNKTEHHLEYIEKEIKEGQYGEKVKKAYLHLNKEEKRTITTNLLHQCTTGESLYLYKNTMKKIFKKVNILKSTSDKEELIIHLQQKETKPLTEKLETIKDLFLPLRYQLQIYYESFCGIIGTDELMTIEKIVIY